MQKRFRLIVRAILPALLALAAVTCEPALTAWAKQRESVLPVVLFVLLAALFQPNLRYLLTTTLCYSVSFLALRDLYYYHHTPLPANFDYEFLVQIRLIALSLVAALAALAALGETFHPGTVWARRCYFAAASLYFGGIGLINFGWHHDWQSVILCATGVIAFFGAIFAPRIVATEKEEAEIVETLSDEEEQRSREAAHKHALRMKEWRETLPGDDSECGLAS